MAEPHWYLIRTARHHEKAAATAIEAIDGVEPYLPLELDRAKHGRKLVDVDRPLFPQYLFARFDLNAPWWQIKRSRWVEELFCHDLEPVRIPDRQIEAIQHAEHAGAYNRRTKPPAKRWPIGCQVRISDGPLAGFLAEVTAEGATERGNIRVRLLLAALNATVPAAVLEKVG